MDSFNEKPSTISFNYNNVWPATNSQDENLDFSRREQILQQNVNYFLAGESKTTALFWDIFLK